MRRVRENNTEFDVKNCGKREALDAIAGPGICRVRFLIARRLAAVRDQTGRPAGGGAQPVTAGLPDGRPQAAYRHRPFEPDGARFFGWEVADAAALDLLAARLEEAEVDVIAEPPAG